MPVKSPLQSLYSDSWQLYSPLTYSSNMDASYTIRKLWEIYDSLKKTETFQIAATHVVDAIVIIEAQQKENARLNQLMSGQ
jgi:hypothetical protein